MKQKPQVVVKWQHRSGLLKLPLLIGFINLLLYVPYRIFLLLYITADPGPWFCPARVLYKVTTVWKSKGLMFVHMEGCNATQGTTGKAGGTAALWAGKESKAAERLCRVLGRGELHSKSSAKHPQKSHTCRWCHFWKAILTQIPFKKYMCVYPSHLGSHSSGAT